MQGHPNEEFPRGRRWLQAVLAKGGFEQISEA
jgi:hypothetical protein